MGNETIGRCIMAELEPVPEFRRTNNPFNQPTNRSMSNRRLLSQQERTIYPCECIEELTIVFAAQVEACKQVEVPITIILMEVIKRSIVDRTTIIEDDGLSCTLAHHLLAVIRPQDVIATVGKSHIAVLLADADQVVGAKVCQRIKESVHKYGYLHHKDGLIEVSFGVADDNHNKYCEIESIIFAANRTLTLSRKLGDGAIVRSADLGLSSDLPGREHFFPGDRLSSRSK